MINLESLEEYICSAIYFLKKTDIDKPLSMNTSCMDRIIAYQDVLDKIEELKKFEVQTTGQAREKAIDECIAIWKNWWFFDSWVDAYVEKLISLKISK